MTAMRDQRCPDCGKLLFKAAQGTSYDIEIICSGIACKAASRIGETRIKRLTYPNPITKSK